MEKAKEAVIDMAKYVNSHEVHEKCAGCDKVFDWAGNEGTVVVQKCSVYIKPSVWWEDKPVAIRKKLITSKTNPKGIWTEVPAVIRMCPMATHIRAEETVEGVKLNPIKAAKRARSEG